MVVFSWHVTSRACQTFSLTNTVNTVINLTLVANTLLIIPEIAFITVSTSPLVSLSYKSVRLVSKRGACTVLELRHTRHLIELEH